MSRDFELRRIQEKISELRKEREQATHLIVKMRRDEQMDIDRVRRNYDIRVRTVETRQQDTTKEIANKERELENLIVKIKKEQDEEESNYNDSSMRDGSGRHRLR